MSVDATRWAWQQSNVTPAEKLVLLALADRADEQHRCYPSTVRLVKDTRLYRETIFEATESLERLGLIKINRQSGLHHIYTLLGVEERHANRSEKADRYGKADRSEKADGTSRKKPTATSRKKPTENLPLNLPLNRPEVERARAGRLPVNWIPDKTTQEWTQKHRPDLPYMEVLEAFRDYWAAVPGQRGCKLDWNAAWRTWVRRESDMRQRRAGAVGGKPRFERPTEIVNRLIDEAKNGR